MARCPSLPVEMWELILGYASDINDASILFAFYKINTTTRSILSDPNHTVWSTALSKTANLSGDFHKLANEKWVTLKPARKYLSIACRQKCTHCKMPGNLCLYYVLKKKLCLSCFHELTISSSEVRTFFPKAKKLGPGQLQFPLPGLDESLQECSSQVKNYLKSRFLRVNSEFKESVRYRQGVNTFEEHEAKKTGIIDDVRRGKIKVGDDGCFVRSLLRTYTRDEKGERDFRRRERLIEEAVWPYEDDLDISGYDTDDFYYVRY